MSKIAKKILMACSNYWSSPFQVGSHHLARGFVKAGWKVAFVSDPISPLHVFNGISVELRERWATYRAGGNLDLDDCLWAYVPAALLTPHNKFLLKSEWVHRNWFKLTWPNVVNKIVKEQFGEVDLLYIDSVTQLFWLNNVKYKKSVLRIPDKNTGFVKFTPAMVKMERELARTANMVIYTAQNLENYVRDMKPREMLYIPNGVDFTHFSMGSRSMPPEYEDIPKPIAVYVGAMDVWFDYRLVNRVAEKLPGVSFVLIGPDKYARTRLESLPNIYLLGHRNYAQIPSYLHNANVGIIPFNVKGYPDLVHSVHPLKLYEYMACGLPVVSVEWDELIRLKTPALLCRNEEQFIKGIQEALQRGKQSEFIDYAKEMDWECRVNHLIERVGL